MAAHKAKVWREVVSVKPRFLRSVHLEHDVEEQGSLEGYVVTPLVRSLTGRILEGLRLGKSRAWSITGPYGTGTSAFAVFLADVLSPPELDTSRKARPMLADVDPSLAGALSDVLGEDDGLCPVLATGERRSLDEVLLRALERFVDQFWSRGPKPSHAGELSKRAKDAAKGRSVSAREVVALFEQTAQKVAASKHSGRGLLVVLDEAGKVLEHAAQRPEHRDVQLSAS
jgi:hypothetical protein